MAAGRVTVVSSVVVVCVTGCLTTVVQAEIEAKPAPVMKTMRRCFIFSLFVDSQLRLEERGALIVPIDYSVVVVVVVVLFSSITGAIALRTTTLDAIIWLPLCV